MALGARGTGDDSRERTRPGRGAATRSRAGLTLAEVPITYRFTNSSLRRQIVLEALRTCGRLWVA